MYAWLRNYSELEYEPERPLQRFNPGTAFPQISWEKIETSPVKQMSLIGQFFSVNQAWWNASMQSSIVYRSEESRNIIMKEIAPHFEKVMAGAEAGESQEHITQWNLSLKQFRPESLELFEQTPTAALSLLKDIYRHRNFDDSYMEKGRSQPSIRFRIDPAQLEPCPVSLLTDLTPLKEFLRMTFFDKREPPEYAVTPLGWTLDDDLKHSPALRFFASFVPTLELYVDAASNQVDFVLMSFSSMTHVLKLNRTKPSEPRVHQDHLYFDMGQQLVKVVDLKAAEQKAKTEKLTAWEQIEGRSVYLRNEGVAFEEFNHEKNGEIPQGVFFLHDQPTMNRMLDAVLHELAKRS
ncbi:hypothetical protein [Saccharibacillus sacchari]|uniref:hypothetical protein n=1 Tax=Saccharibacillus sacchari TaxID=456493 RepID=UPI0004B6EB67|nr:hypothetical protein [Saccharibacillus sacchari]